MISYIFDIGMVFDRCGCECVVLIHRNVKSVDHNFQPGTHMAVHVLAFCLDDLDICVALPAPISAVTNFVGTLATKSHDLCLSMDCIRPIEHCIGPAIAWQALDFAFVAFVPVIVVDLVASVVVNGYRLSSS